MKVELITDWSIFPSLREEWNKLLLASRSNTIFLTWEWINSWREVVGKSLSPIIVTVRDSDDKLIGIAPFYITEHQLLKTVKYKVLRFMADHGTGLEYPDWIANKDFEHEIYRHILDSLLKHPTYWDCIWMPNIAGWTGANEKIENACKDAGVYFQRRSRDFACVKLPSDIASYEIMLTQNRRSLLRRQTKAVSKRTGVRIMRCRNENELSRYLDLLFELHHLRRKKFGDEGTFKRKPHEALFYRNFAKIALENNWLWLFGLEDQGQLKAVQIGYVYNNIFHQLQEGFDPDYIPGSGNVLRAYVIESCISEGISEYDFLGEFTEHKKRWLATERTGYDIFIGRKTFKNHILFKKEIWPTGRFFRPINLPWPKSNL